MEQDDEAQQGPFAFDYFTQTHIFVIGEENGSLPVALKGTALSVTASYYGGIELPEFRQRLEDEGSVLSTCNYGAFFNSLSLSLDIPILLNVDARQLHTRVDLPFQDQRMADQTWVLWWQCPYVDGNGAGETLRAFVASAQRHLIDGDLIVIGWAQNWEHGDPHVNQYNRVDMYQIDALIAYSAMHGFDLLLRDDQLIQERIQGLGYEHRTNQGVTYRDKKGEIKRLATLTGPAALQFRTLVLRRNVTPYVEDSSSAEE